MGMKQLVVLVLLVTLTAAHATAQRMAEARDLEGVELIADVPYAGTQNPRQRLDLMLPEIRKPDEKLPVVVFVHGGGWQSGSKEGGRRRVASLAASGRYAAVSVGYRLTDEATWPSQIHDVKAAIRWVRAHAERYGLDASRIGVMGPSAGGHLAAVLGSSGDAAAIEGDLGPHVGVSSRVACVVDMFGPTDLVRMMEMTGGAMRRGELMPPEKLVGGPIREHEEEAATANPITYVTPDDPPFLLIHGTVDPVVPFNQSELLHTALKQAGVASTLVAVEGGGHGRGFGPEVQALVERFFAHHLLGEPSDWEDHAVAASRGATRR